MKTYEAGYAVQENAPSKEPLFVVQVSWDIDDTDFTYLTSSNDVQLPVSSPPVDLIKNCVLSISGSTQKINPDIATSTIGAMSMQLVDVDEYENLLVYSESFINAAWGGIAPVIEDVTIAPDGSVTADLLDGSPGSSFKTQQILVTDDSLSHTVSVYLKRGSGLYSVFSVELSGGVDLTSSIYFTWATHTAIIAGDCESYKVIDVGGGWYRLAITISNNNTGNNLLGVLIYPSGHSFVTGTVYAWGAQVSKTKFLTNYSKTEATTVLSNQNAVTAKINEKLTGGDGLRGKVIRVYVGYNGMPFSKYDLRLTYIVDSISYMDGKYTIKMSDVQRVQKHQIFIPDETTLASSITNTDMIIPITTPDATKFPLVSHGAEWSVRPSEAVSYVKLKGEVICHSGVSFDTTNGWHLAVIERGALNTRAIDHAVGADTEESRRPKIVEHIYIEGAAPKVIYALLTGVLLNGSSPENSLPDHWHLGINESFVRLSDFQNLGVDLWNTSNDTGRFVRIENPKKQDGKRYIEKEMLLWMGCFMPIYSTGELGIRKLAGVLSDASYQAALNKYQIKSYSALTHDMRSVINSITVNWNWVDSKKEYTKLNVFIDADSISKHQAANEKTYSFKAVHTGLHTDEDLLSYFDILRDRYSGPPLLMKLELMPSSGHLEVGDIVHVSLDQVRDFNTNTALDRAFEIQQVNTDWVTGRVSVSLFGSSQRAGELDRTTLATVLQDSFYSSAGSSMDSSDSPAGPLTIVAGQVTVDGTLTGHANDIDSAAAIYYYDGDLTINAGVTVTITENVQLRVMGVLLINGTITGVANGATGGAATTQFVGGTVVEHFDFNQATYEEAAPIDVDLGEQGYFGTTWPPVATRFGSTGSGTSLLFGDFVGAEAAIVFGQLFSVGFVKASIGVDVVPFFQLNNDQQTNLITGYPSDLRGNSGSGGFPMIRSAFAGVTVGDHYLIENSGVGGNGGAGLLIVSRGMAFGIDGEIDLSGGDSGYGAFQTYLPTGINFYAGSGAPGAAGALLVLLDGQVTSPDVTELKFIANFGSVGMPPASIRLQRYLDDSVSPSVAGLNEYMSSAYGSWVAGFTVGGAGTPSRPFPYQNAVYNPDGESPQDSSTFDAAHRVQYVPKDETPVSDDSNFSELVSGQYKDLLFFQSADTAVAGTGYGADLDIVGDGSRFVVGSFGSLGVDDAVQICRSIATPVREQTITDVGSALGFTIGGSAKTVFISDKGDRISVKAWSYDGAYTDQGAVYIYSRSGVTWTLEQRIIATTPKLNGYFGSQYAMDRSFDNAIMSHFNGVGELQYWTRSGSVWSYQNDLPTPSNISGVYSQLFFHVSGDGKYVVLGDDFLLGAGGTVGSFSVWSRTGTTWTLIGDAIQPDESQAYRWGESTAINHDGTVIVVVAGEEISGTQDILIYYRQSESLNLIQRFSAASTGFEGLRVRCVSASGLTMVIYDRYEEKAFIYRRVSVEQGFVLTQEFENQDAGAWGANDSFVISDDAQWLITGNYSTDVGATNSGSIHARQFMSDAEK